MVPLNLKVMNLALNAGLARMCSPSRLIGRPKSAERSFARESYFTAYRMDKIRESKTKSRLRLADFKRSIAPFLNRLRDSPGGRHFPATSATIAAATPPPPRRSRPGRSRPTSRCSPSRARNSERSSDCREYFNSTGGNSIA